MRLNFSGIKLARLGMCWSPITNTNSPKFAISPDIEFLVQKLMQWGRCYLILSRSKRQGGGNEQQQQCLLSSMLLASPPFSRIHCNQE
jgi:hypothetical protein